MQPNNQPNYPQQQPPQSPYQGNPGGPAPGAPGQPPEYQAASQKKHNHSKGYLIWLIIVSVLFIATAVFAGWAFLERQEYKDETDAIVAEEVEAAVEQNTQELEADFTEREKEPLTSYSGPAAFGAVTIKYPKTWSAYINEDGSGSTPVEGYFHPSYVPDETGDTKLALTFEVSSRSYQDTIRKFDRAAQRGEVTVNPIKAPNVEGVTGVRVDGEISRDTKGSVVMFELRDKTLILTTQSTDFVDDFDDIILENLTFNP